MSATKTIDRAPAIPENPIDAYAVAVVDGGVPAGKYHRLACARHVRDRAREGAADFPYRFDLESASRFFRFAAKLKHYKGQWAGQPIQFTPIQLFRLGSVFGWRHASTGIRRFRTAYNELPRKQGKSLEAAVVALYVTFFDGEAGAEGYCIATKRDQAKIVFGDAKKLVSSSGLKARINVQVGNLHRDDTSSKLEPLGADGDSTDGLSPNLVIVDEVHAHKTRDLMDVMETATGARRQPLTFQITTAGNDLVSPCGDQHEYACKVLDQVLEDESFFAIICSADPGDDWQAEATWIKANPHYGISVNPEDMRALARKAKGIPAAAAAFKQKRLNLWNNGSVCCLSLDGWRLGQSTWSVEDMVGAPCYVGIDLAKKTDLCAVAFVFPPTAARSSWRVWSRIFTPAETLADRAHRDRAPYQAWVDAGWLIAVDGPRIETSTVKRAVLDARSKFKIQAIGVDPWHSADLVDDLVRNEGFDQKKVIDVPQTYAGMSAACLEFQGATLAALVDAGGCPVTAWAVSNVVANEDGKENLLFAKKKSKGRIDPVVAAAVGVALKLRDTAPKVIGGSLFAV